MFHFIRNQWKVVLKLFFHSTFQNKSCSWNVTFWWSRPTVILEIYIGRIGVAGILLWHPGYVVIQKLENSTFSLVIASLFATRKFSCTRWYFSFPVYIAGLKEVIRYAIFKFLVLDVTKEKWFRTKPIKVRSKIDLNSKCHCEVCAIQLILVNWKCFSKGMR